MVSLLQQLPQVTGTVVPMDYQPEPQSSVQIAQQPVGFKPVEIAALRPQ